MKNLELTFWICVSILGAFLFTGCKVYQIDASNLSDEDKERLFDQRNSTHVRLDGLWYQNPFYNNWGWNQFYWNNGWDIYQYNRWKHQQRRLNDNNRNRNRTRTHVQPNRRNIKPRNNGSNTNINPVRGSRGSRNYVPRNTPRPKVQQNTSSVLQRQRVPVRVQKQVPVRVRGRKVKDKH